MDELKAFLKSRSVLNLTIVIINILVFFLLDFTGNTENAQFMTAHGACYAPWVIERGEIIGFLPVCFCILVLSIFLITC